jgi:hypothetical protein
MTVFLHNVPPPNLVYGPDHGPRPFARPPLHFGVQHRDRGGQPDLSPQLNLSPLSPDANRFAVQNTERIRALIPSITWYIEQRGVNASERIYTPGSFDLATDVMPTPGT